MDSHSHERAALDAPVTSLTTPSTTNPAPACTDGASERAPQSLSRRQFLGSSLGTAAAFTGAAVTLPAFTGLNTTTADPGGGTPSPDERKDRAYKVRVDAAYANFVIPPVAHPVNGDEALYPTRIGSYSKGLPHNAFGEVNPLAYQAFLNAVDQRTLAAFDSLPIGTPLPSFMKFVNPMAGVAYDLEGIDSHEFEMIAAPAFDSPEEAGEIVENYWMAILRDVPFERYGSNALVGDAVGDMNQLSDFRGPKFGGLVTRGTLFREALPDTLVGPFISQFFYRSQPFGAQFVEPRMRTVLPGQQFLIDPTSWRNVQNGRRPTLGLSYDNGALRYIRNGRDLGEWVHIDVLYQAYFQAGLHCLVPPDPANPFTGGGLGLAPNPGNPYLAAQLQEGFGTFGGPYFMTLLTEVATRALKAAWYQKWFVHRRLRPEAFGGRIHHKLENGRPYPIHPDALNSKALSYVHEANGTYFLPMAFPEGSPMHPAYAAGHATVAGACVTVLKALFDTQVQLSDLGVIPVVPTDDGLALVPYPLDVPMTVEGELNKLAHNVAYGRNIAGVHWRSDGLQSLYLGEAVAISVLRDQRNTYCEPFTGFTFRDLRGNTVTV